MNKVLLKSEIEEINKINRALDDLRKMERRLWFKVDINLMWALKSKLDLLVLERQCIVANTRMKDDQERLNNIRELLNAVIHKYVPCIREKVLLDTVYQEFKETNPMYKDIERKEVIYIIRTSWRGRYTVSRLRLNGVRGLCVKRVFKGESRV